MTDYTESTLKNTANQIIHGNKEGHFTVQPNNDDPEDLSPYDQKEVNELLNFWLIGEEGKIIEPFLELGVDRKVLKEIAEQGTLIVQIFKKFTPFHSKTRKNSESEETECAVSKVCCMAREARQYADRYAKYNAKLHYFWSKALRLLKSFTKAKQKLLYGQKIKPNDVQNQNELKKLEKDKEFNNSIATFTLIKNEENTKKEYDQMPSEFWDTFNKHLEEFDNGFHDLFTVLTTHPEDIELIKPKASLLNFQV